MALGPQYLVTIVMGVNLLTSLAAVSMLRNGGQIWGLLAAGSWSYSNYRHQADICHAYHILRDHGVPEENIIVMMYDDIAYNPQNPVKGNIINRPAGPNVYKGVKIDYRGQDVTADNFIAVLTGNSSAVRGKGTGRVINSGPNDHIFVNFVDHGGPGILCFPSDYLFNSRLENTFDYMTNQKKFGKMLIYLETCCSGSMFQDILPDDTNIMAVTATNPSENSWGCYCENTSSRGTCLGDCFSVSWMEDAEFEDPTTDTIHDQFEVVQRNTTGSHVCQYGQLSLGDLTLSQFLGREGIVGKRKSLLRPDREPVISRDVPLMMLHRKLASDKEDNEDILAEIQQFKQKRQAADAIIDRIVSLVAKSDKILHEEFSMRNQNLDKSNRECYEKSIQLFDEKCFKIPSNPYIVIHHLHKFVKMCSSKKTDAENIRTAIEKACKGIEIRDVVNPDDSGPFLATNLTTDNYSGTLQDINHIVCKAGL